jgi:hypothetical protein
MSWILNRAGQQQQEGPYEDGQIVYMIQSGQLREGFICAPGTNQWVPLGAHPPFAEALGGGATAGRQKRSGTMVMSASDAHPPQQGAPPAAAPAGWGAPQAQGPVPGYGASPGYTSPAAVGAGVAGPAPGAPPAGWGGAAQAMPPTAGNAQAPAKKGKAGLVIGVVVGLLVAVGLVVGLLFVFAGGGSRVSKHVPQDVLVFVEFPNSATALKTALGVDFLDPTKIDADKQLQNAVKSLTDSFQIDKGAAESLLLGLEGGAFAMRRDAGRDQAVVLLTFRKANVVEPWLKSERVTKEGKFGSSGERYFVATAKTQPAPDAPPLTQAMAGMSVAKDSKEEVLVWFPEPAILAMGNLDLLDDVDSVITKGEGSLAENEGFKQSEFKKDSTMIGYVSPDVLDEVRGDEPRKLIQGYLDGVAPFTLDASFVDAGMLTRLRGQFKGNRITADEALPNSVDLTLAGRLPIGTLGYVAVGSERTEDGKAMKTRLIKQIRATDEGAAQELETSLQQLEQSSGVSFDRLIDAIGNEMVFGLVVDSSFKLGLNPPPTDQLDKLAGVLITQVGKEDAAADVVKQARVKLFEEGPLKPTYVVKQQGIGFQGLPSDPKLPTVQVFFHEGRLLIGVGGKQVLAKALLALGGKEALSGDKAHEKALQALGPKPRILMWVDSGRIGGAALAALPEEQKLALKEAEKQFGVSHEAVKLTGDDRITAAAALFAESNGDVWNASLETLNAPSLGVLAGIESFVQPPPPPPIQPFDPTLQVPGLFLPQTGVPQCDGYLIMMFQCGERTKDPALTAEARALEARLKGELTDPTRHAAATTQCSQDLLQFLVKNQKCAGN